jgi:hypothetical protein
MTEPGSEDEFEAFLKRRTVLPNGMSDDDKLEPPKALDAIVLRKAREAIHARRQPNRAPRWATPVALAATILLCLSIVLNVSLNTNRPAANLQQMTAGTADKEPLAPASPASEGKRREKVSDDIPSHEVILPEARIAEAHAIRPPVLAEAPTPSPAESSRATDSAADKLARFADGNRTAHRAPSEAPFATNSAAGKAAQLAERSREPTQAPGEAPSTADRVASLAARADAGIAGAQAPASPPSAAAAPSPSGGATSASPPSAAPTETLPRDRVADAQDRDQPALAKRQAAAAPHPQDPKIWLQQIDALRAAGKTAQAEAEMQRFRATFPAYPAKPDPLAPSEPPK